METRKRRKISRRTIVKLQVSFFLGSIFAAGFIAGLIVGKMNKLETVEVPLAEERSMPIPETPVLNVIVVTPNTVEESQVVYYDVPLDPATQDYIFTLCEENNVPSSLVIALIDKESCFVEDAVSSTGDYGYMQINECNFEWLEETYGVSDFLSYEDNILCGVKILSYYLETYDGDFDKVLMAYNFGEGRAKELWAQGVTFSEYSREVVEKMNSYEEANHGTGNETH